MRVPNKLTAETLAKGERGEDIHHAKKVLLSLLIEGEPLPASYLDHPLKGDWKGFRDAHIDLEAFKDERDPLVELRNGVGHGARGPIGGIRFLY